ncbi:SDR family NAD(P)-dependent oxidoreductase, partial [Corallococcus exiguus]|uniref:SDR family NAD(P)-dependent oxidoreductase n=1 Tax=Corallococcus exiguus TaxID=83462 RepID=UPI0014742162
MSSMSVLSSFRIEGRTALVTGSSRGIGRAIALALAEAGADVVVHSGGEVAEAESVASEIRRLGRRAAVVTADLGESTAVDVIADACATLAPVLDILVLNAAVQIRKSWTTIELEDATTQIQVNLLSSLALMQTFVPSMAVRGWGRALIIGSIQERKPHPEMAVYA